MEPAVEAKVEDVEAKDHYDAENKFAAFEERIAKLEARAEEAEMKLKNINKFEALATEAIDGIYKNTTSTFKPEAKSVGKSKLNEGPVSGSGSLFSKMKQRAGLK